MKKMVDKLSNKKAQGLPTSTLVLMVIAILVLVFVVLGFVTGWGYIFDKIGLLPNDLTSAAAACEQYSARTELRLSFCEYKELTIDGKKGYYNCLAVKKSAEDSLGAENVKWGEGISCSVDPTAFCTSASLKEGTFVSNGAISTNCPPVNKPAAG